MRAKDCGGNLFGYVVGVLTFWLSTLASQPQQVAALLQSASCTFITKQMGFRNTRCSCWSLRSDPFRASKRRLTPVFVALTDNACVQAASQSKRQ